MGKIISVVSGKGGVGKSTLATLMAINFANLKKRTLIIEGDVGLRSIDIALGLDNVVYDLSDFISESSDSADVMQKCRIKKYLYLISAVHGGSGVVSNKDFAKAVSRVKNMFDIIIIDSSSGISNFVKTIGVISDLVLVVTNPDIISVRSAGVIAQVMREVEQDSLRLVINKANIYGRQNMISDFDRIIDSTSIRLIGVVPTVDTVGVSGKSSEKYTIGNGLLNLVIRNICRRTLGEDIPLKII